MHFSIHYDVNCESLIKGKNCERTHCDQLDNIQHRQWHAIVNEIHFIKQQTNNALKFFFNKSTPLYFSADKALMCHFFSLKMQIIAVLHSFIHELVPVPACSPVRSGPWPASGSALKEMSGERMRKGWWGRRRRIFLSRCCSSTSTKLP